MGARKEKKQAMQDLRKSFVQQQGYLSGLDYMQQKTKQEYMDLLDKGPQYSYDMPEELNKYLGLAETAYKSDMPGMDIYQQQAATNLGTSLQGVREMGGGGAFSLGAIAQLNRNSQLAAQDLAIQQAQWKAGQQQNLMNAYQYATEKGTERSQLEAYYNQILPYTMRSEFLSNEYNMRNPIEQQMGLYGDQAGVALSKYQSAINKQVANRQFWGQIAGSTIGAAGDILGALIGKGGGAT